MSLHLLTADASAPIEVQRLHREMVVPASLAQTWTFFADAANLERITPPWLQFSILTSMPVQMRVGAEITYRNAPPL